MVSKDWRLVTVLYAVLALGIIASYGAWAQPAYGPSNNQPEMNQAMSNYDRGDYQQADRWNYGLRDETTITGTIVEGPGRGLAPGMASIVTIRTSNGDLRRVELGPAWYQQSLDLDLRPGDTLTIIGAPMARGDRSIFIARQIDMDNQTYRFRSMAGAPLWAGARNQRWMNYSGMWDSGRIVHMTGRIDDIRSFTPARGMGEGTELVLRPSGEGRRARMSVHLGPSWFVNESLPRLRRGQEVSIVGSEVREGRNRYIVASQISYEGRTLQLRSDAGMPRWAGGWQNWGGWGPGTQFGRLYNPASIQTISGRIDRISTSAPTRGMGQGVVLRLSSPGAARIDAYLGPSWYLDEANLDLRRGDRVTVSGSIVTLNGRQVLLARDISAHGMQVALRDNSGAPLWMAGIGPGYASAYGARPGMGNY